jgi:hypothetical protein
MVLAVAAISATTTIVLLDQHTDTQPASHTPILSANASVAPDRPAQVQPVAARSADAQAAPLTAFPDVIQSTWLYAFADRIVYAPSDADTDECVRREGYYSQAEGMQLEQVDTVLHPDGSVDLTTRRPPVITHHRFASMTLGDVSFEAVRPVHEHEPAGELNYVLGRRLPRTEQALFATMYADYAKDPTSGGIRPVAVLRNINSASIGQTPRLDTRKAMLQLLARMPGVHVEPQAQDPLLRLTVAIILPGDDSQDTLYVDPNNGQVSAYTEVTLSGYTPRGTTTPHLREAVLYQQGCR